MKSFDYRITPLDSRHRDVASRSLIDEPADFAPMNPSWSDRSPSGNTGTVWM